MILTRLVLLMVLWCTPLPPQFNSKNRDNPGEKGRACSSKSGKAICPNLLTYTLFGNGRFPGTMKETEDARIKKIKFKNTGKNMEFKTESEVKTVRDAATACNDAGDTEYLMPLTMLLRVLLLILLIPKVHRHCHWESRLVESVGRDGRSSEKSKKCPNLQKGKDIYCCW